MDEQTTKEVLGLQNHIKYILTRKRQRENSALEEEFQDIKHGLASSNQSKVALWLKNRDLQASIKKLELQVTEQEKSIATLTGTVNHLKASVAELQINKRRLDDYIVAYKKAVPDLKTKLGLALQAVSAFDDDTKHLHE